MFVVVSSLRRLPCGTAYSWKEEMKLKDEQERAALIAQRKDDMVHGTRTQT